MKRVNRSKSDLFDCCYKKTSILTSLRFKLKQIVQNENLPKEFSVTLYTNSVFIIPLSMNILYTHEIRPSVLLIDKILARMGYLIRCSKTAAIFKDNKTYSNEDNKYIKLEKNYVICIMKKIRRIK